MASSGVIRRPVGGLTVARRSITSFVGLGLDPVGFEGGDGYDASGYEEPFHVGGVA